MLLQIHDELLFEGLEEETEAIKTVVIKDMEGVASLDVPLKVDMGMGKSWGSTK